MLNPRASGAFIASNAKDVRVNPHGVETVAKLIVESIRKNTFLDAGWDSSVLHPIATGPKDEKALNWCLFADAINFSFWTDTDREGAGDSKLFTVTYKGKSYNGWHACCALINRAIDNGFPFTDAQFVSQLTYDQMKTIFAGDDGSTLPMLAERRANLVEAAEVLLDKFDGSFGNCVELAGGNAQKLLRLIVDNFPSFRDMAEYEGRPVSFLKRAQILVSDAFSCIRSDVDLRELTMFADYRVPQVLVYFEALEYSIELKDLLRKRRHLTNGSRTEVEIRGCSIHAVELIVEKARSIMQNADDEEKAKLITAARVDYFLWCYRRLHSSEISIVPFHRTRCIYY